jgi:nucleotide-binding universal stress UspA family protein
VHGFEWAALGTSFDAVPYGAVQEVIQDNARQVRDDALAIVRAMAPDVRVTASVLDGSPAALLVRASETATVVVVGHRGRGGFPGLLVGSVAAKVAAHAACPVLVVRPVSGAGPNAGRVVVGVDGSPHSAGVLEFAFEEASMRGVGLTAVHAWRWPAPTGADYLLPLIYDAEDLRAEEVRLLTETMAGWQEKYPDVDVRRIVVQGRPGPALLDAARDAALLVVGARGRGGFTGLLLGTVGLAALHHAPCPVAIVHP